MSTAPTTRDFGGAATSMPDTREAARTVAGFWWLWLVTGVAWVIAALVIAQFDQASITTVGVIVGVMFMFAAIQQVVLGAITGGGLRWLWWFFALLFFVAGIVCFINPENTFAAMADILGFLFLAVAVSWTIRAFVEREAGSSLWWMTLIAGLLMVVLAFITSGQFFFEKAYTLLVFAGIWALLHGVGDIAKAFMIRSARDAI